MAAPRPKRKKGQKRKQAGAILGVLLLCGAGYGAYLFKDRLFTPEIEQVKSDSQAWYKKQSKAPEMIRAPDAPLILAAKDAEIDTTIQELKPKKPLKVRVPKPAPAPSPSPRVHDVDLSAKPTPPAAVYEEALPQDVYTPPAPIITAAIAPQPEPKALPSAPETPLTYGLKPRWMKYALDVSPSAGKPMIALVIDDLGLDRKRTARTLALAGPMTMAFIPYSKNLSKQATSAQDNGHELLLHMPMEPLNEKIDAGPNNLNTHLAEEDLIDRIHWNLERFSGYVGINNHMGSKATANADVMSVLMKELSKREMLFLDSRTNPKSVGAKYAGIEGVPFAERNVFIDNVNEKGAVLKQLSLLEKVSRKRGFAVGIGHPRDGTIEALKEWLPDAKQRGFALVPISHIVKINMGLS